MSKSLFQVKMLGQTHLSLAHVLELWLILEMNRLQGAHGQDRLECEQGLASDRLVDEVRVFGHWDKNTNEI